MKISPRDILIAAVVGIIVIAVVLVALVVLPQNAKLSKTEGQIAETQTQIEQARALLARRQTAKKRASMTASELLRLANAVPETPELPALMVELEDLTQKAGLQFRTLTPGQPAPAWSAQAGQIPPPSYLRIPMKMTVYGTWSDTVDLMQRLQKLPRQLRITSFTCAFSDPEDQQLVGAPDPAPKVPILTEIGLEAYVLPSEGSTATPQPTGTTAQ